MAFQQYWTDIEKTERNTTTGTRSTADKRMIESATYLADHLGEVPVLLLFCLEAEMRDVSPFHQATAYGSVLLAAWSFILAARARGFRELPDNIAPQIRFGRFNVTWYSGHGDTVCSVARSLLYWRGTKSRKAIACERSDTLGPLEWPKLRTVYSNNNCEKQFPVPPQNPGTATVMHTSRRRHGAAISRREATNPNCGRWVFSRMHPSRRP